MESSGVLVGNGTDIKRGWDWRASVSRGAEVEAILRWLRVGLAREVADAWVKAL
jgi:hypothetical protein